MTAGLIEDVDLDAWALVAAAQQGDARAYGDLYRRYCDVVFRFVLFRIEDRHLAEDITSETFLRALRRLDSVSYQGRDVGAWFVTIARNLVFDHCKSSRARLEIATFKMLDAEDNAAAVDHDIVASVVAAELWGCVSRLVHDQQECVRLRFQQGLSVQETADVMGRSCGSVKALQHRAIRRLRQLLPEGIR